MSMTPRSLKREIFIQISLRNQSHILAQLNAATRVQSRVTQPDPVLNIVINNKLIMYYIRKIRHHIDQGSMDGSKFDEKISWHCIFRRLKRLTKLFSYRRILIKTSSLYRIPTLSKIHLQFTIFNRSISFIIKRPLVYVSIAANYTNCIQSVYSEAILTELIWNERPLVHLKGFSMSENDFDG